MEAGFRKIALIFGRVFGRVFGLGFLSLVAAGFMAPPAYAVLQIDISQGVVEPMPVAVTAFVGTGDAARVGRDIAEVVAADLERSGYFRPIYERAFIEKITDSNVTPRFGDWRIIDVQGLVIGQVVMQDDGRLKIDFRLWDVFNEKQLEGLQFFTDPVNWRRVAHLVADAIYERLTGAQGYFDTRVVFISESGPKNLRIKQLAIMDQDGVNLRMLTDGGSLVLTPRFSPTSQEITYMSYTGGSPRVYLYNIETGEREVVGDFPGMTFAPRFSPDGQKIIMSLQRGGNANIYTLDLRSHQATKLTNTPSIDTAPSYSPDGQKIVFESDRGGAQHIYVMGSDGQNPQRISFGKGSYSTPVWSPAGDFIAFTRQYKGRFQIGVMRPDGSGERVLTEGFHNEGPTWAPNGRVLMFFRETPGEHGGARLWSVDISGYNERMVETPSFASDPAWSPLIN